MSVQAKIRRTRESKRQALIRKNRVKTVDEFASDLIARVRTLNKRAIAIEGYTHFMVYPKQKETLKRQVSSMLKTLRTLEQELEIHNGKEI